MQSRTAMISSPDNDTKMKDLHSGTFQTLLLPSCVALECRGYTIFLTDRIK